jgi:hypothetical protein
MLVDVQILEVCHDLGPLTGLTGSIVVLTGVTTIGLADLQTVLTSVSDTGLTGLNLQGDNSAPSNLEDNKAELQDWRKPIIDYLRDPCQKVDRKVRRFALKLILVDEKLYHRTTDDLLLECLDLEKS